MPYQTPIIPFQPIANPEAVVIASNARFTILTNRLIRMEFAAQGVGERVDRTGVDRAEVVHPPAGISRPPGDGLHLHTGGV